MDLIIKAAKFVGEFNDIDDELNIEMVIGKEQITATLYEDDFTLHSVWVKDNHDLENFITFCQNVRAKG